MGGMLGDPASDRAAGSWGKPTGAKRNREHNMAPEGQLPGLKGGTHPGTRQAGL